MLVYVYTAAEDDGPQHQEVVSNGESSAGTQVILDRGPKGLITGIEIIDASYVTVGEPFEDD